MEVNPEGGDGDSEVGSENMPQLEAASVVEPEILDDAAEDVEGGDNDEEVSNEGTPILEQQQIDDDDADVAEHNDDEEMIEDEIVEGEEEEEDNNEGEETEQDEEEEEIEAESVGEDEDVIPTPDENHVPNDENEIENDDNVEEEEEEEEYENGNPSAQNNNNDSSDDGQVDDKGDGEDESGNKNVQQQDSLQEASMEDTEKSASESDKVDTIMTRKRSASISSNDDGPKRKSSRSASTEQQQRTHDNFCWVCHKDGVYFMCKICPRSYHMRCICLPDYPEPTLSEGDGSKNCICPECVVVMNAENVLNRSAAMKQLSMSQLVSMLTYICGRMKQTPGVEPFLRPVQASDACDYYDYIIYPMDIQTLEKNIKQRQYGSTEAFLADAQWLVHNSIIFNSSSSPYTASAKRILKVCRQELSEIETCPECYTNAHTKSETWFVEACKRPHILVWAKLKGFPFWPAKAMKIKDDQVDVRFFGQHDRAWVNLKDCYLYSEEMPASPPKKNAALLAAIDELNTHVKKLNETYGTVVLAPGKAPLGRELSISEIQRLLPDFKPEEPSQPRTSAQVAGKGGQLPKSPMTITISSLKTNPTIVNNTVTESPPATTPPSSKPSIKSKRLSSTVSATDSSPGSSPAPGITRAAKASTTSLAVEQSTVVVTEATPVVTIKAAPASIPDLLPPLKHDEQPKEEKNAKKELEDDFESRVPSGEILANALGLKRITRRLSQTDTSTASKLEEEKMVQGGTTSMVEKRLVRGSKADDSDASLIQAQLKKSPRISATPVEPTPAVTQQPPITVNIKTEPMETEQDDVDEEENPFQDAHQQQDEKLMDAVGAGGGGTTFLRNKAQDFMEHISTQAQTKPGYRFNISKDISISAIGQDNQDVHPDEAKNSHSDSRLRKSYGLGQSVTVNTTGGVSVQRPSLILNPKQQQMLQANSPAGNIVGSQRPRFSPSQALQPQAARFINVNRDLRALTRLLRPASAKTPPSNAAAAGSNVRQNRAVPGAIQMSSLRQGNSLLHKFAKEGSFKQQQPIIVDSTLLRVDNSNHYGGSGISNPLQKVGPAIQVNQVQSVQSQSITLPGGTITVTPLSALQGGNPNTNNYGSSSSNTLNMNGGDRSTVNISLSKSSTNTTTPNGLPTTLMDNSGGSSSSPAVTATPMKTVGKSLNSHGGGPISSRLSATKGLVNMVPPSVVQVVQGLQKSVSELIRQGAEQIAVEMVEHQVTKNESDKNYKLNMTRLQEEHDKLVLKHIKEITDMRHNHEILMRELRSNMDNEKKRAIADLRRQLEQEKQKAVEEAKKKQWCAHCLRQAQFYCCWNTSYCGYPCQENHWPAHMKDHPTD